MRSVVLERCNVWWLACGALALAGPACGESSSTEQSPTGSDAGGASGGGAGGADATVPPASGGRIEAGTGGVAPTPSDGSSVIPVDETTLARAVVAMNSCFSDDGFLRTLTYLRGTQGGYAYLDLPFECLAAVGNGCDGVMECYGLSRYLTDATTRSCDGNFAILEGSRWDCSRLQATCRDGTCVPNDAEPCSTTFTSGCDVEGRPVECDEFVQRGPLCSDFGLSCVDDASNPYCSGTGAACTSSDVTYFDIAPLGVACQDDNVLSACVGDGMAELDCRRLGAGFTCQSTGEAFFCGIGNECDPLTFGQQCNGATVVFCDAGRIRSVDCVSLGFVACGTSESAACRSTL